jgi:hypothetical protein
MTGRAPDHLALPKVYPHREYFIEKLNNRVRGRIIRTYEDCTSKAQRR